MNRPTIRITAIILVLIATLVALLGFDFVTERQKLPPKYRKYTLDA